MALKKTFFLIPEKVRSNLKFFTKNIRSFHQILDAKKETMKN